MQAVEEAVLAKQHQEERAARHEQLKQEYEQRMASAPSDKARQQLQQEYLAEKARWDSMSGGQLVELCTPPAA